MAKFKTCHNCPERHEGCHSDCERYLEEVRANEALKESTRQQKSVGWACHSFRDDQVQKMIRAHHKR